MAFDDDRPAKQLLVEFESDNDLSAFSFNPDQPRDERGQWTDDGGEAGETYFEREIEAAPGTEERLGVAAQALVMNAHSENPEKWGDFKLRLLASGKADQEVEQIETAMHNWKTSGGADWGLEGGDTITDAVAMAWLAEESPTIDEPLYRGMTDVTIADFTVGEPVDIGLASFTKDQDVAEVFAHRHLPSRDDGNNVIVEVVGAKGFPVDDILADDSPGDYEQEIVVTGDYVVKDIDTETRTVVLELAS